MSDTHTQVKESFLARYRLRVEAMLLLLWAIWMVRYRPWASLRKHLRSAPGQNDEVMAERIERAVMFAEHYVPITGICLAVTIVKVRMYRLRNIQYLVLIEPPRYAEGAGHIFTSRDRSKGTLRG